MESHFQVAAYGDTASALQHEHSQSFGTEFMGHGRAAKPGANDDYIEGPL